MRVCVVFLLAAMAAAQPRDKEKRPVQRWLEVDPGWQHLELAEGVKLGECRRNKGDSFPFLLASREEEPKGGYLLTASNLHSFLAGPISNQKQALEAARTFIAGPMVTDVVALERVVAAAKQQPKSLAIAIHDFRPKSCEPVVTAKEGVWTVSFVALRMSGRARLIHVVAKVPAKGEIRYEIEPIVDGPQLSWQSAFAGTNPTEAQRKAEADKRAQARSAMLAYGKALELKPSLDVAWALARVRLETLDEVEILLGERTAAIVGDVKLWQYTHADWTLSFAVNRSGDEDGEKPIEYVSWLAWERRDGVRAAIVKMLFDSGNAVTSAR